LEFKFFKKFFLQMHRNSKLLIT